MTPEMLFERRIVREVVLDDGTTGGRRGFVDEYGVVWTESSYNQDNYPTDQRLYKLRNGRISL